MYLNMTCTWLNFRTLFTIFDGIHRPQKMLFFLHNREYLGNTNIFWLNMKLRKCLNFKYWENYFSHIGKMHIV